MPRGIDPKRTEAFLMAQPEVLDASVWMTNGRMHAHVTLPDNSAWDARRLRVACAEALGIHQAPEEILLRASRKRAA